MYFLVSILFTLYFPLYTGIQYHIDHNAETQLITAIRNHPDQQRRKLIFDPILQYVARQRAIDMGKRKYFAHVNPEGIGPNHLIFINGFSLPRSYLSAIDANNIESIGGGYNTAQSILIALINSPSHREHILGEGKFFGRQNKIGIGVIRCRLCVFRSYWVILIAESLDVSGEAVKPYVLGLGPMKPEKEQFNILTLGPSPIEE